MQASLKRVGVEVELQNIEGELAVRHDQGRQFRDVAELCHQRHDRSRPAVGFMAVNPERANAYHTQWKDEESTSSTRRAHDPDGPERGKQFKEIEQLVHDGRAVHLPLHADRPYANRKNVSGFEVLPTSNYSLKDVIVK